jgi:hypothetical protein
MQCQHCHKALAGAEPVYRAQLWDGHPWCGNQYPTIRHLCAECGTSQTMHYWKWHPAQPCHDCHRPVFHGAARKVPSHVSCSPECNRAVYAKLAHDRRRRAERVCRTCGALFLPKRADALTCSPACRQRAYRQRRAA